MTAKHLKSVIDWIAASSDVVSGLDISGGVARVGFEHTTAHTYENLRNSQGKVKFTKN